MARTLADWRRALQSPEATAALMKEEARADMVVCKPCSGTGFSDKLRRGMWTMEPKDKICPPCGGRGWVKP